MRKPALEPEFENPLEAAQAIAVQALTFLAVEPNRLVRFFGLTGLSPDGLRQSVKEPEFLLAVVDYLLEDESLLLVFCEHCSIDPKDIQPAREQLAGAILRGAISTDPVLTDPASTDQIMANPKKG